MASGSDYQRGTTAAPQNARRVLASLPNIAPPASLAQASLTTALAGANNDLTYTSRALGTGGNATTITYVVAGNNTPLSVSVTGSAITVNVATNGGGAATSTAAQVAAAVAASAPATALVDVANATGNDGTGVVTALTATPLAGGSSLTPGAAGNQPLPTIPPIHYKYV